jgi:hypothetical protein
MISCYHYLWTFQAFLNFTVQAGVKRLGNARGVLRKSPFGAFGIAQPFTLKPGLVW